MHLRIVSIGKSKSKPIKELEQEFLKRLQPSSFKLELLELNSAKLIKGDVDSTKKAEAKELLSHVKSAEILVALDETGTQMSSVKLSSWLQTKMNSGTKGIVFAIGGAYGFDKSVLTRADLTLSLSEMTFPYQFARLILIEQIYRAASLLSGSPYHKE